MGGVRSVQRVCKWGANGGERGMRCENGVQMGGVGGENGVQMGVRGQGVCKWCEKACGCAKGAQAVCKWGLETVCTRG